MRSSSWRRHAVYSEKGHAAQDERCDTGGKSRPRAIPHAATAPALIPAQTLASVWLLIEVDRRDPSLSLQRLAGLREGRSIDDLRRAQALVGTASSGRPSRRRPEIRVCADMIETLPTPPPAPVTSTSPLPGRMPYRSSAMTYSIAV